MSNATSTIHTPKPNGKRLPTPDNQEKIDALSNDGYTVLTDGEAEAAEVLVHSSLMSRAERLSRAVKATPKPVNTGYDPDAFLAALVERHDALAAITDALEKRHAEQEARQQELDTRDKEVTFREKRISAHERLVEKKNWRFW